MDTHQPDAFAFRKALIYTRESPKIQVALNASDEELRQYADENGITIAGCFSDIGVSRYAPLAAYPQLRGALALLDYGDADAIIVTDLQRGLPDGREARGEVIARIHNAGAHVIEKATGRIIPPEDLARDPEIARYIELQRRASEDEIYAKDQRLKRGRERLKARRGYLGGHRLHLPYAQELVVIDGHHVYRWIPERVKIVREIVTFVDGLALQREYDGYRARSVKDRGFAEMARRVNARGIPAVGREWYRSSIEDAYRRGLPLSRDDEIAAFGPRVRTMPVGAPVGEGIPLPTGVSLT